MSKKWNKNDWIGFSFIIGLVIIVVLFVSLVIQVGYEKKIVKKQEKQLELQNNLLENMRDYYELIVELNEMEIYIEMLEDMHELELEMLEDMHKLELKIAKNDNEAVVLKEYVEILALYFDLDQHEKADDFSRWLLENYPHIYRYVNEIN